MKHYTYTFLNLIMKNKLFISSLILSTLVLFLLVYLVFPKIHSALRDHNTAKKEKACEELARKENERFNNAIDSSTHIAAEEISFHFNAELGSCYFLAGQTTFLFKYVNVYYWITNLNTGERVLTYSNFDSAMTEEEFFEKATYYMSN